MTPTKPAGSPIICRSQSITTCSSSVAAGEVAQRHALRADGGGEHLAQDRRRAVVAGEVGEPAGVVPMRHARHDHPAEVVEQRVERLAVDGRRAGNLAADVARGDGGGDRAACRRRAGSRPSSPPARGRGGGIRRGACAKANARPSGRQGGLRSTRRLRCASARGAIVAFLRRSAAPALRRASPQDCCRPAPRARLDGPGPGLLRRG